MSKRLSFILAVLLLALLTVPALAQDGDEVTITFPPSVFSVEGDVQVIGTVNVPNLQSYYLEVSPIEADPPQWIPVSLPGSAPVTNGVIGQWPSTLTPDGVYKLRVVALLRTGESRFFEVEPIRVANALDAEAVVADAPAQAAAPTDAAAAAVPTNAVPTSAVANAPTPTNTIPPEPTALPEPTDIPRPNPVNELPIPVGGHLSQPNEEAAELMRQAGMTWVKFQLPYRTEDFSLYEVAETRIAWAHEQGFRVLLSVKGERDELAAMDNVEYFSRFAAFLGEIADQHPDAIQIWNEQNIDREWPNGQIDPALYTEMLRAGYNAIKNADPEVMVITGAPAPTGAEAAFGSAAVWNDDRYYAGMANAGAAQYADCIGIHYNEGIIPPTARGGDPRDEYPTRYLPSMLERAAFPFRNSDVPLCFSELGYLSPEGYGPLPQNFAWAGNTSVAEQAQWLRDAITVAADFQTKPVELLIVWNVDFTVYTQEDPQGGYAIIRPDGTCPACEQIATLRTPAS